MFDVNATIASAYVTSALFSAAKLGVLDALEDREMTAGELALELRLSGQTLLAILRTLATFKFLKVNADGAYGLAEKSRVLLKSQDRFERHYLFVWGEQLAPAFAQLSQAARSGDVAYRLAHGASLWDHYRADEQAGDLFLAHMNAASEWQGPRLAEALDTRPWRSVCDVGGFKAALMTALLKKNPDLRGVILDQDYVRPLAMQRLEAEGLADRCAFTSGSFLEAVPAGHDLYVIKHVLHDWTDPDVIRILANIRTAMRQDSVLVIAEGVLDEAAAPRPWLKTRNLEQHVWTGGRVRTEVEFEDLLARAGLRLDHVLPTSIEDCSLVFARPAAA